MFDRTDWLEISNKFLNEQLGECWVYEDRYNILALVVSDALGIDEYNKLIDKANEISKLMSDNYGNNVVELYKKTKTTE